MAGRMMTPTPASLRVAAARWKASCESPAEERAERHERVADHARFEPFAEPTASLDARAEYEVFRRFSDLTQGKTAVLISHRFSTVRMADRIIVLDNGEILEIGTHEELLKLGGLYKQLYDAQIGALKRAQARPGAVPVLA